MEKELKKEYIRLCNLLTSKDMSLDNNDTANKILKICYDQIKKDIDDLDYDSCKKEEIKSDIDLFYRNIILSPQKETINEIIGNINLFLLQCIILFTYNLDNIIFINSNGELNEYNFITNDISWQNNNNKLIDKILNTENLKYPKLLYLNDYEGFTFLITLIDYYTIDQIIESFLNKVIYCGFAYKKTYADGRLLTPYEFLVHDIIHGLNYDGICFNRNGLDIDYIKIFYEISKENLKDDTENLYCFKFIIFLLIHESWCDFFLEKNPALIKSSILKSGLLSKSRFLDENDLTKSIPKPDRVTEESILEYIDKSINIYIEQVNLWLDKK